MFVSFKNSLSEFSCLNFLQGYANGFATDTLNRTNKAQENFSVKSKYPRLIQNGCGTTLSDCELQKYQIVPYETRGWDKLQSVYRCPVRVWK